MDCVHLVKVLKTIFGGILYNFFPLQIKQDAETLAKFLFLFFPNFALPLVI